MSKRIFPSLTLSLLLFFNVGFSQWVQTNGPYGGYTNCLAISGTNHFAGTDSGGVFLSTNNGTSWSAVNQGLLTNTTVYALTVSGTDLFAGGRATGVYKSTDVGTTWTWVGLPNTDVYAFAFYGTNFFAGTNDGVFLSTNNGISWNAVNTGLPNTDVYALAMSGTNLFAGIYGSGVFLSTNNGTSWTRVSIGLTNTSVRSLAVSGSSLFAGTDGGVFLSVNNGTNWTARSTGLTNASVHTLALSGTNLFAGTLGGVFLSANNGTTWNTANTGLTSLNVYALVAAGANLFAGTSTGVWRRPLSEMVTSVERIWFDLPTNFSLQQNYPNPFNPATTISFSLPTISSVSLKVFDALGREVSVVVADELAAGNYTRRWHAATVPSGVYYYRMQAGEYVETKKMMLLR